MPGNPDVSSHSSHFDNAIPTGGKAFEDGTLIELVEHPAQPGGLALLMFNGRKSVVAPSVKHGGQNYVPVALEPSLRRALRLPSSFARISSTADLVAELVAVIEKFTALTEDVSSLLVGFVFASWLPDCISAPVNLLLWSPVTAECARVLSLLACFCRQALALSGANAQDLCLLPQELQATLLILRPASSRRTRELLSTCGWRGFQAVRAGRFGEFIGSVALATDSPLGDKSLEPKIEIAIPPSSGPLPVLDERTLQELAREFQPKLLQYRLLHRAAAARAGSTDSGIGRPRDPLAVGLYTCFPDDPNLGDQQVRLLAETGANGHQTSRNDPRMHLVDVLWVRCHEHGRDKVYVAEIAADVNAIFSATGDLELSSRMVGVLLKLLGVRTFKLDRRGRGIKLDTATRKFLHELARIYEVPSADTLFPGCAECSPRQIADT